MALFGSLARTSMSQSLDLVGDSTTSSLQLLPDLDLETKVSSSDVEDDAPSGELTSTASEPAFLAAAVTLGLSILIRVVCRTGACATSIAGAMTDPWSRPLEACP